jgi:hypothetical protein
MLGASYIPRRTHRTAHIALIASELCMGIAAVGGGVALLAGALGSWLPAAWLAGSPFADYRLPALALIALVGGGNLAAGVLLLMRRRSGVLASVAGGSFLIVFEVVEATALGLRFWLQPVCFILGIVILALGLRLWFAHSPA